MMKKDYAKPGVQSQMSFETSALACGKTTDPPPGTWHFTGAYDTFTGHLGLGFSASETISGTRGIGFGPGGSSTGYQYSGLCTNWITFLS